MTAPAEDQTFFDLPPAEEEPHPPEQRYRSVPWHGAPPATIPATVPVERVLARTDDVAVTISALQVYPAGLEFEVVFFSRPGIEEDGDDAFDGMLFHHHHRRGSGVSDDVPRVGVRFADGRKVTTLDEHGLRDPAEGGPVLLGRGGGGGGERYAQSYWLWPLPETGPLTFVCAWPGRGIPVTSLDVDGDEVRAAARRAQVVFPEDHLPERPARDPGDGGWASYVPLG